MIGRKNRTTKTLFSLVCVSLMGVALVTASNAQAAEQQKPPQHCPDDSKVSILCRLKGSLVKKWVCETSYGRGISDDLDEAVRGACEKG